MVGRLDRTEPYRGCDFGELQYGGAGGGSGPWSKQHISNEKHETTRIWRKRL